MTTTRHTVMSIFSLLFRGDSRCKIFNSCGKPQQRQRYSREKNVIFWQRERWDKSELRRGKNGREKDQGSVYPCVSYCCDKREYLLSLFVPYLETCLTSHTLRSYQRCSLVSLHHSPLSASFHAANDREVLDTSLGSLQPAFY